MRAANITIVDELPLPVAASSEAAVVGAAAPESLATVVGTAVVGTAVVGAAVVGATVVGAAVVGRGGVHAGG